MTPALMHADVRAELAGLSKTAKREVRSWLNNKLQIVIGANGNEADDVKLPADGAGASSIAESDHVGVSEGNRHAL